MNKSIIPNGFTSANLASGVLSITWTAEGLYGWAALCILLSLFFDACDGRAARALGVSGPFGRELDSLADVVGFGVAPAFLLYSYALGMLGVWAYVPLLVFAVCGALRLARFNIMTTEVHGYFQGLAIPTGGCLAATYVLSGVVLPAPLIALCMVLVGFLMVSEIRYPDFKGGSALRIHPLAIGIVLAVGVGMLYYHMALWPVLPFGLYTLFGPVNSIVQRG